MWFAENAFARGAMSALAASALATSTIRLGVGVFNPFNRHPTLIAMEMAALDELSDGRVVLGIGSGIRLGQMGVAAPRRPRCETRSTSCPACYAARPSSTKGRCSRRAALDSSVLSFDQRCRSSWRRWAIRPSISAVGLPTAS